MQIQIPKDKIIPLSIGPSLTIITTVLLLELSNHGLNIPPLAIYTLLTVFGTYTGGWFAGSITAILGIIDIRLYLSQDTSHFSSEEAIRFWIAAASMPFMIWLVGRLKQRSERLFEAEKESAVLITKLEEQQHAAQEMLLVQYSVDHALESVRIIREDGSITYSNASANRIFGHEGKSWPGHKVWECDKTFTPETWAAHWAHVQTVGMTRYEISNFSSAGKPIRLEMLDDYVHNGENGYIVSHGRDITERHIAEEQIRNLNQELEERVRERTEKLESINKELESFTYSISHDLKAPLRAINGYAGMLMDDYADKMEPDCRQKLEHIKGAAGNMREMVDDLLIYSRVERRTQGGRQVNISRIIADLLREKAGEIEMYGILIRVNLPFEMVMADPEGLRQVLRNLLDNAIKFTRGATQGVVEIGGQENADQQVVWVRDNGIGFDMKYHDRIFELFQRLHNDQEYPGTGLGLSIVHKAMDRMNGKVYAQSAPGQGATFYLEFPKAFTPLPVSG